MKMTKIAALAVVATSALVAGPAFAADGAEIAAIGTQSAAQTGYAVAAMGVMGGAAIGLAYVSGMIKTAMGWGKAKK